MAKKTKTFHMSSAFTLPLAVILPVISPLLQYDIISYAKSGDWSSVGRILRDNYGFNDWAKSWDTYSKIAYGLLIHRGASMLGLNAALGRAKVPILRI